VWLAVEPSRDEVVLRVRDEGVGIDPARLPALFEGAPSAGEADERPGGPRGLGLGLALARRIVSLHGGTITARSEGRDRGAELELRLPRLSDPRAGPGAAAPAGAVAPGAGAHRRILVVEDEPDVAHELERLLLDLGHDVLVAPDVGTALDASTRFAPEVVLADIGLAGEDGCEVARALRGRPGGEGLLLLALTGFGAEPDRARTRAAGFDQHLLKPLDPAELERLLAARFGPG
jgi:CheY-like chemotaxis protein